MMPTIVSYFDGFLCVFINVLFGRMKKSLVLLILLSLVIKSTFAFAATVTCEVEEVSGSRIILNKCDERAKSFEKGNVVKVKLNEKKGRK